MGSITGHSAGFGRIGAETRPSMYSPWQFRSVASDASRAAARRRDVLRKRVAAGLAVAAVVVVVGALAGVFVNAPSVPPSSLEAVHVRPPTLDAEAERLGRSAFARQRNRG